MERCNKLAKVYFQRLAESPEFDYINAALSALTFTDKRLALSDPLGEFFLSDARPFTDITKMLEEAPVLPGRN